MRFEGPSVIGLTIMPLSDRFTRSTSDACSSIDRFLWITPRPPCCAIAIASADSVTVSMAALTSGTFSRMLRVRRVETSTCVGRTVECCGTRRTSSKVRAVASSVPVGRRVSEPVLSSIEILLGVRRLPVAFLVLLSAAARAWIVPPDLRLLAPHRLDHVVAARSRGRRALPSSLRHSRGSSRARRPERGRGLGLVHRDRRRPPGDGTRRGGRVLVEDGPQPPDAANHRFLHPFLHPREKIEAFTLVFDQ